MTRLEDAPDFIALLRRFDPDTLVAEVTSLGDDFARKNAEATFLEDMKKVVLSRLTKQAMSEGPAAAGEKVRGTSVASAELTALASPFYETHLRKMVMAREESDKARVRYEGGKTKLELMRSQLATLRQEMQFTR